VLAAVVPLRGSGSGHCLGQRPGYCTGPCTGGRQECFRLPARGHNRTRSFRWRPRWVECCQWPAVAVKSLGLEDDPYVENVHRRSYYAFIYCLRVPLIQPLARLQQPPHKPRPRPHKPQPRPHKPQPRPHKPQPRPRKPRPRPRKPRPRPRKPRPRPRKPRPRPQHHHLEPSLGSRRQQQQQHRPHQVPHRLPAMVVHLGPPPPLPQPPQSPLLLALVTLQPLPMLLPRPQLPAVATRVLSPKLWQMLLHQVS
jgi:hypothetical protein